jgi:hypothetical protein
MSLRDGQRTVGPHRDDLAYELDGCDRVEAPRGRATLAEVTAPDGRRRLAWVVSACPARRLPASGASP